MSDFDLVVIGGGPGGYVAAIRAAQLGLKTALVEGHKLGGECLNYGCIPSKAMITVGVKLETMDHMKALGIFEGASPKVNLSKLVNWKSGVVKTLTGGIGQLLRANGVSVFQGLCTFDRLESDGRKKLNIDPATDTLTFRPHASSEKPSSIFAKNVVIATGSSTIEIPGMPFDGKMILGSREALDVEAKPESIVVIGGGFIGLEIGTFFSKIGTKVTIVEATSMLLPGTDRECVAVVEKRLKKKGVEVLLNTKALGVEKKGNKARVKVQGSSGEQHLDCDWVLVTVGRKPRTQGLSLEKIGLKANQKGFIDVNQRLETSVPGVFAIGDVIGGPMLAHKASKEGLVVAETIKDPKIRMDVRALPWAIFVDPEIATVGHTEESAKAAGWDPVVGKCPFAANGRALTAMESEGFVKIIADRKTDRVLGAHLVGPDVSNLVAELAVAIEMGATASDIANTVHAHPTLPETLMEAAESVHGMAVHFFERKPRRGASSAHP